MEIKETGRRSMWHRSEGDACGPVDITTADAEITAECDGKPLFFHAQWVSADEDSIMTEATTESVYELCEKLNNGGDPYELSAERDRITVNAPEHVPEFEPFYDELRQMIRAELKAHGIEPESL